MFVLLIIAILILAGTSTGPDQPTGTKAQRMAQIIRAGISQYGANLAAAAPRLRAQIAELNPTIQDLNEFVSNPQNADIATWLQSLQSMQKEGM